MNDAFRLDRIHKTQGRLLFQDLTLRMSAGEAVALVGASGVGKTTLLRIVAGLDVPDSGDVWIGGQLATKGRTLLVPPRKRGIGFVFQDLALWPHMTVAQSLEFVVTSATPSLGHRDRSRTIGETLKLVHIDGLANRYPHQLSGGEQQRAAFARALVHRPALVLLDEPFSSLDIELRQEMRTALREFRGKLGFAMVFVTHDRNEAAEIADRTVALTRAGVDESAGPFNPGPASDTM